MKIKDFTRAFVKPDVSGTWHPCHDKLPVQITTTLKIKLFVHEWLNGLKKWFKKKDSQLPVKGKKFGVPKMKNPPPPPKEKSLVDAMSKVLDDKYSFFVKVGILSQEEFNEFKTEKIYFDLKSHFSSSKHQ